MTTTYLVERGTVKPAIRKFVAVREKADREWFLAMDKKHVDRRLARKHFLAAARYFEEAAAVAIDPAFSDSTRQEMKQRAEASRKDADTVPFGSIS